MAKLHQIVVKVGAGFNLMTREEWHAIPLPDKMKMIFEKKVKFLDDLGGDVPVKDAIAQLTEERLAGSKTAA